MEGPQRQREQRAAGNHFSSSDGFSWVQEDIRRLSYWTAAYGRTTFVISGYGLLQTGPLPAGPRFRRTGLELLPGNSLRFFVESEPVAGVVLETSNDLKAWTVWKTLAVPSDLVQVIDATTPATPQRFYRARALAR